MQPEYRHSVIILNNILLEVRYVVSLEDWRLQRLQQQSFIAL